MQADASVPGLFVASIRITANVEEEPPSQCHPSGTSSSSRFVDRKVSDRGRQRTKDDFSSIKQDTAKIFLQGVEAYFYVACVAVGDATLTLLFVFIALAA